MQRWPRHVTMLCRLGTGLYVALQHTRHECGLDPVPSSPPAIKLGFVETPWYVWAAVVNSLDRCRQVRLPKGWACLALHVFASSFIAAAIKLCRRDMPDAVCKPNRLFSPARFVQRLPMVMMMTIMMMMMMMHDVPFAALLVCGVGCGRMASCAPMYFECGVQGMVRFNKTCSCFWPCVSDAETRGCENERNTE